MRKGPDCDFHKRNASVIICDRYFAMINQDMVTTRIFSNCRSRDEADLAESMVSFISIGIDAINKIAKLRII